MGLKDRLAARKRPSTPYSLRIDDDAAARAELAAAQAAGDDKRAAKAREAIEACYEQVTIVALPPGPKPNPQPDDPMDLETLRAAHLPTHEQRAKSKDVLFNPQTFVPALLAVCVESDVTEAEWAEYVTSGAMTTGEVSALFNLAWEINYRIPDPAIPLG
jgi:hypothetical protein